MCIIGRRNFFLRNIQRYPVYKLVRLILNSDRIYHEHYYNFLFL